MKYYFVAGERSGDLHGSNLIKALRKHDANMMLRGFGGEYMQEAGLDLVVHYRDMAFMGFVEVLKNLNTISKYIRQCKEDLLRYKPDVLILIDYGGFNMRIAKFAKQNGIKVFYYITPKVWAWNQNRAFKIKASVDKAFVILPFEKDFFKKFGIEADYVGNPVLDAIKSFQVNPEFLVKHSLHREQKIVALLPGSRKQELQRMLPVMADVVKQNPSYQFVIAAVKNLDDSLYNSVKSFSNVKFVYEETYDLLASANVALVTSGTATLETALFKVPQIVIYKASVSTYWIVKLMIRVRFISLVNLIADKEVVREMIQRDCNAEAIGDELNHILNDESYRHKIWDDYNAIYKILDTGSASENAARLMSHYLMG